MTLSTPPPKLCVRVDICLREARSTTRSCQRLHLLDREFGIHVAAEVPRLARDGEWFNGDGPDAPLEESAANQLPPPEGAV